VSRWRLVLLGAALTLAWIDPALARPGGGQSYDGDGWSGGGGGGDGGGDGGGELIYLLIRLVFFYPQLGVPLLIIAVVWYVASHRKRAENWDSSGTAQTSPARDVLSRQRGTAADPFAPLSTLDPAFSRVVFEDFAYRLFATAHRARHDARALSALAPYLSETSRSALASAAPPGPISAVVIGSMNVRSVQIGDTHVDVSLRFEANLTAGTVGQERTFYTREAWRLSRAKEARSKPPGHHDVFGCPNCGAPFGGTDQRRCEHCGQVVSDGRFEFQLRERSGVRLDPRPPALTSNVQERGNDRATVRDANFEATWAALTAADPRQSEASVHARLGVIYEALNRAWVDRELTAARPYVSDGMFDYLNYWIQAYRSQGLVNRLDDMRVLRSESVKVLRDPYFDSLTVRVWASGKDYTIDVATGAVLSGSASSERAYTEYWTLIRGSSVRGAPRTDSNCPQCAAPLSISMAGVCEYCKAHITSGEFDWVLSKIEQDEAYLG
jgi:hypothetical protein